MADKLNRVTWFYDMGMLDAFDYVAGTHPSCPDDYVSIEERAEKSESRAIEGRRGIQQG